MEHAPRIPTHNTLILCKFHFSHIFREVGGVYAIVLLLDNKFQIQRFQAQLLVFILPSRELRTIDALSALRSYHIEGTDS